MRTPIEQFRDMCIGPVECGKCDLCSWKAWRRRIASGEEQTPHGLCARRALRDLHRAVRFSALDKAYWIPLVGDPTWMQARSFDGKTVLRGSLIPFYALATGEVVDWAFALQVVSER